MPTPTPATLSSVSRTTTVLCRCQVRVNELGPGLVQEGETLAPGHGAARSFSPTTKATTEGHNRPVR